MPKDNTPRRGGPRSRLRCPKLALTVAVPALLVCLCLTHLHAPAPVGQHTGKTTTQPYGPPRPGGVRAETDQRDYGAAVSRLVLAEASEAAQELGLEGGRAIESNDVRELFVVPGPIAARTGMLASLKTPDYVYSIAIENKLSFISRWYPEQDGYQKDLARMRRQGVYATADARPAEAVTLARRWLTAAKMDTKRLDKECKVEVKYWQLGNAFVPLYWVRWYRDGALVAYVELFEPGAELRAIRVEDPRYNLRQAIRVEP